MVAGGILIAAWGGFRNRLHTIVLSYLVVQYAVFAWCNINFWVIPTDGNHRFSDSHVQYTVYCDASGESP
jgi:hypothetical protein